MSADNSVEALLFTRARDHLTDDDLASIVNAGESLDGIASNAAALANGLGCMVMADGNAEGAGAGNFQSSTDVPYLLWHFAQVFERVAALAWLTGEAHTLLHERAASRAAAAGNPPAPRGRRPADAHTTP